MRNRHSSLRFLPYLLALTFLSTSTQAFCDEVVNSSGQNLRLYRNTLSGKFDNLNINTVKLKYGIPVQEKEIKIPSKTSEIPNEGFILDYKDFSISLVHIVNSDKWTTKHWLVQSIRINSSGFFNLFGIDIGSTEVICKEVFGDRYKELEGLDLRFKNGTLVAIEMYNLE